MKTILIIAIVAFAINIVLSLIDNPANLSAAMGWGCALIMAFNNFSNIE